MFIGDDQIKTAVELLKGHLCAHQEEMEDAFCESDDEEGNELSVSLKVVFSADKGGVMVKTSMSFYKGKITEKDERITYPTQKPLFTVGGEK